MRTHIIGKAGMLPITLSTSHECATRHTENQQRHYMADGPINPVFHTIVLLVYLHGSFHLLIVLWKLPPTSMEVNQLPYKHPSTSMEAKFTSMEVNSTTFHGSKQASMETSTNFHGS